MEPQGDGGDGFILVSRDLGLCSGANLTAKGSDVIDYKLYLEGMSTVTCRAGSRMYRRIPT